MQKSYFLILLVFTLCSSIGYSQLHNYKHYGVEDGLPSSEVYSAFQDSKGYMWFATDAGVSRFNGYEFENFDVSDGLTDNTVFLITEDSKERIWFGTFNCQLSYYDYAKDSIYPYKYNKVLKDSLKEGSVMQFFYIDVEDNFWMGFLRDGIYQLNKDGDLKQMIQNRGNSSVNIEYFDLSKSEFLGVLAPKYSNKLLQDSLEKKIALRINLKDTSLSLNFQNNKDYLTTYHIKKYKEGWFFLIGQKSFFLEDKTGNFELRELNDDVLLNVLIHSLTIDDKFLWFSTRDHGVYQCEIKDNKLVVVHHFFSKSTVSKVFKDNNNGYWFMALKTGYII